MNDKPKIRAEIRAKRSLMPKEDKEQAQQRIGDLVLQAIQTCGLPTASVIALYWPMADEPNITDIASVLTSQGFTLALPAATDENMSLEFRLWGGGQPRIYDALQMPTSDGEVVKPNVIVAPLLAMDDYGMRLGQGGGYYDRTFEKFSQALRIGVCFNVQRVGGKLPHEPHDVPLHMGIDEKGVTVWQA